MLKLENQAEYLEIREERQDAFPQGYRFQNIYSQEEEVTSHLKDKVRVQTGNAILNNSAKEISQTFHDLLPGLTIWKISKAQTRSVMLKSQSCVFSFTPPGRLCGSDSGCPLKSQAQRRLCAC